MIRKWMLTAIAMCAGCASVAGLSFAADEGGPVHEAMEAINKHSAAIKKSTRTKVAYAKSQKELPTHVAELIKLGKETREHAKEAVKKAKNVKDGEKQWVELCDHFIKELEKFSEVVSKPSTDQAQAKSAYSPVSQSCTKCHEIFRVEEDF